MYTLKGTSQLHKQPHKAYSLMKENKGKNQEHTEVIYRYTHTHHKLHMQHLCVK